MNKQTISFTASEQTLTLVGDLQTFASNTVSYIDAQFTLSNNWTGYDSVRAVWRSNDYTISTILNSSGKCTVPAEVLYYKSNVFVNLVGTTTANDEVTERLTTEPIMALNVTTDAEINSTETADITPSQFEQFVAEVSDDAASAAASAAAAAASAASLTVDSEMSTSSTNPVQNKVISGAVLDLKEDFTGITQEMTVHKSNNLLKSNDDYTIGYISQDGSVYGASTLGYTRKFPVSEGDVVRVYGYGGGSFQNIGMRYVCAYDANGDAVTASGAESVSSYTVPSGIAYVALTFYFNYLDKMVTINYEASSFEPYYIPYYTASEEFVADVLDNYQVPTIPVKGYNLLHEYEEGVGMYDKSGGKATYYNYSSYKYAILPIKQNTNYYIYGGGRVVMLTDDSDTVLTYFGSGTPLYCVLNSGLATKLYFTAYTASFESDCFVVEGIDGMNAERKIPAFVSGINQRMMDAKYGCALPKGVVYFTNGFDESWYYENALAIPTNHIYLFIPPAISTIDNKCLNITPNISSGSNSYGYEVYDDHFSLIDEKAKGYLYSKANNLQNASVLAIGDSTVAGGQVLQGIADAFSAASKTLTTLGTRGTAPINHEGRSGWSLKDYCTESSKGGIANPFYNSGFDFSYYMTNQGYSSPDFVIIQMGINDLYNNIAINSDQSQIDATVDYLKEIITSILTFNQSQKILVNLPVGVNSDWSKHSVYPDFVRNKVIRYNEAALALISGYTQNVIRPTYCHLILNPSEDIRDDVHPTDAGYAKMANEVVSQINCWQNA